MSKQTVAFIGLGVMGYPMAGHLANAGYRTRVYNRTTARAEQWCRDYEGEFATTPRATAEGADFVFICVGNDDDLRSVVYGDDGVLAGCKEGAIKIGLSFFEAETEIPNGPTDIPLDYCITPNKTYEF